MTRADILPARGISFPYRLTRFGGKISKVDSKTNKPEWGKFCGQDVLPLDMQLKSYGITRSKILEKLTTSNCLWRSYIFGAEN